MFFLLHHQLFWGNPNVSLSEDCSLQSVAAWHSMKSKIFNGHSWLVSCLKISDCRQLRTDGQSCGIARSKYDCKSSPLLRRLTRNPFVSSAVSDGKRTPNRCTQKSRFSFLLAPKRCRTFQSSCQPPATFGGSIAYRLEMNGPIMAYLDWCPHRCCHRFSDIGRMEFSWFSPKSTAHS